MIDIGPNLSNERFDNDLQEVILRSKAANVCGLILTSTDLPTYYKNQSIIDKFNNDTHIYTTYGLHPHKAMHSQEIFENAHLHLSNPTVVAIGEFGLDYFRMLNPKEMQLDVMEKFVILAKDFPHLPLFLHEREAFSDFYSVLKNVSNKKVVHCFTGNKNELKHYLDLGCYIGITGWISDKRRNSDLVDALSYLPLDRLMIETDCPYLTPKNMPTKQYRNEPAFLPYVAQSIAEILNLDPALIIEQTTKNSLDFFNINSYNNKKTLLRKL